MRVLKNRTEHFRKWCEEHDIDNRDFFRLKPIAVLMCETPRDFKAWEKTPEDPYIIINKKNVWIYTIPSPYKDQFK